MALSRWLVPPFVGGRVGVGLLALRAIIGLAFVFHGYPKMQHPSRWMGAHAFAPGWLQAVVALVEFGGGIALIVGLLTPLATALIFCDMFVALFAVEFPRHVPFVGGRESYELPLVYLVAMLGLFLTGPGAISLDAWLNTALTSRRAASAITRVRARER
ncbi:MAG TPA: DoxX family protein [Candidatus Acidoferrum sp.]|nr:DoxX family protein [Candidatus Acidoferrum sp.]